MKWILIHYVRKVGRGDVSLRPYETGCKQLYIRSENHHANASHDIVQHGNKDNYPPNGSESTNQSIYNASKARKNFGRTKDPKYSQKPKSKYWKRGKYI